MQPTLNDSAKEGLHDISYKIAFTSIQEHCFKRSQAMIYFKEAIAF